MLACAFVITFAGSHACFAEDKVIPEGTTTVDPKTSDIDINDELLGLEDLTSAKDELLDSEPASEVKAEISADKVSIDQDPLLSPVDDSIDFLNDSIHDDIMAPAPSVAKNDNADVIPISAAKEKKDTATPELPKLPVNPPADPLLDVQPFPDDDGLNSLEVDADKAKLSSNTDVEDVIPEIGSGKSPFENFGNAILSKVDSDLFNQMSNIEKQTTLLRLELRREELKNRVAALRTARLRAQQEEDFRLREEAEKLKDLEAQRQAQIIAEEEKLKQREIELEKVRQAKVLNDYMNEMLAVNQQWVAKNAELQNRIHELEEERKAMQENFRNKISQVQAASAELKTKAESTIEVYRNKMETFNNQINQLKLSLREREDEIKQISNPFSENDTPSKDAIDMSKEYAIMDITGKGDDVIAKIVSKDGTTFIVHKGSMLKNGEVVTSITDHYISFENNGVKSFLYTGGTVMEFEPVVTFNGSDRTPSVTKQGIVKGDSSNVLGNAEKKNEEVLVKRPRKTRRKVSFNSGTFVQ